MLAKAKDFMSSADTKNDVQRLLKWTKEASKEDLIETVKNKVCAVAPRIRACATPGCDGT